MTARRAALALLLATAACRQAPPAAEDLAVADKTEVARPAAATRSADATDAADLSRYVGAYPFDTVNGRRFLDEPAVRAALARLAPDPAIAARIVDGDGPRTPIRLRGDRLVSWGCEAHNCGAHNWALLLAPDGSDARLCYKPDGGSPRWYGADPVGEPKDGCPSGDEA